MTVYGKRSDRINSGSNVTAKSKVRIKERIWLSDRTFELRLSRPAGFDFQPGHRIRVYCQGSIRDYSLSSIPTDTDLKLCIRHVVGGLCSPYLASADIGSCFEITGPHGYFLFRDTFRPAVFVATGTGIAPFVSMVRSGIQNVVVLHGVTDSNQLCYESSLKSKVKQYVPCLSRQAPGSRQNPDTFFGRVTDFLKDQLMPEVYDFYLCGRSEMIRDTTYLVDDRFPGSFIYSEIFY